MTATFIGMSPVAWSALAEWGGVILALVAGLVAYKQLGEARRLREDQAQPYVAVFAEESPADFSVIDLVIKNFGRTVARNICISVDPPLMRAAGTEDMKVVEIPAIIPTLVPGQEWRTLWDTTMARPSSDLPTSYHVSVSFRDSRGREFRAYESMLDWTATTRRDIVEVHGIHGAVKALRRIATTFEGWTENPLRGSGLRVSARDGDELDRQYQVRYEEERRHQEEGRQS
jgi:hypothetical protein